MIVAGRSRRCATPRCATPGRGIPGRGATRRARLRNPIGAELSDHELAEGVVEVRGIVSAARSLLPRVAGILECLLVEHLLGLRHSHPFGLQSDRGEQAHVAQQSIADLPDVHLGITLAEPLLPHHLLCVVRPALRERVPHPEPLELVWIGVRVQELQEVAGPYFVRGGEQERGLARDVLGLLRLGPFGIRGGDVVGRGDAGLVRSRNLDERGILAVVGRRLGDQRLLVARNAGHVVLLNEVPQHGELPARGLEGPFRRLLRVHLGDTRGERAFRQVGVAFAFQHVGVALKVRPARRLDLIDRHIDLLGVLDHRGVEVLAHGKFVVRGLAQADQVIPQVRHRVRCIVVGLRQVLLHGGIAHRGEHGRHVLLVEIDVAAEVRDP